MSENNNNENQNKFPITNISNNQEKIDENIVESNPGYTSISENTPEKKTDTIVPDQNKEQQTLQKEKASKEIPSSSEVSLVQTSVPLKSKKWTDLLKRLNIKHNGIAIILGLILAMSSIYQINQMTNEQREVEELSQEIADLESLKDDLLNFEFNFRTYYYNLWSADYEMSIKYPLGLISRDQADSIILSSAIKFYSLQDEFLNYFFEKNQSVIPGTGESSLFAPKKEYRWLFKNVCSEPNVKEVWNETLGFYELVEVENITSIIAFDYIQVGINNPYQALLMTEYNAKNLVDENWFYWNESALLLDYMCRRLPVNMYLNMDLYNERLDQRYNRIVYLESHIDHLSNNLLANGIAVLLISFLMEFNEGDKILKWLYMFLAIGLGLFSILGAKALISFYQSLF